MLRKKLSSLINLANIHIKWSKLINLAQEYILKEQQKSTYPLHLTSRAWGG